MSEAKKQTHCECETWATDAMLPGKHHYRCPHFDATPTLTLLRQLVDGIDEWASMEDGVYSTLWPAYVHASSIIGRPVKHQLS